MNEKDTKQGSSPGASNSHDAANHESNQPPSTKVGPAEDAVKPSGTTGAKAAGDAVKPASTTGAKAAGDAVTPASTTGAGAGGGVVAKSHGKGAGANLGWLNRLLMAVSMGAPGSGGTSRGDALRAGNELLNDEEGMDWKDTCKKGNAKWFFRVGYNVDDTGNYNGVILDPNPEREKLPPEAKQLLKAIETASVRLRTAFRNYPEESRRLFRSLKNVAKIGLYGQTPDPELAQVYFDSFKGMVPVASNKVRKKFLYGTVFWNLAATFLALFVYFGWLTMHSSVFYDLKSAAEKCNATDQASIEKNSYCQSFPVSWALGLTNQFFPDWGTRDEEKQLQDAHKVRTFSNLIMGYALSVIGGSCGLVLIGFLRNREISYDSFDAIYKYGMSPGRYLLLIMVLALVVLVLVAFKVFILGVGNVELSDVTNKPQIGLVIGLLCSISEPLVSGMVINQVKPAEGGGK